MALNSINNPPAKSPIPAEDALSTVLPKAIPPPPDARLPPPSADNVAFVAAIPDKSIIAVPVDAVHSTDIADVVAPAAAKPPATPVAILPVIPKSRETSPDVFFNSCIPLLSRLNENVSIFLNSGLPCILSIQSLNVLKESNIFISIFPSSSAMAMAFLLCTFSLYSALF